MAEYLRQVMINNAAARVGEYTLTKDGFESQFGIDHLAHFLFTNLVLPKLRLAQSQTPVFSPRIVFVASGAHARSPIRFDDLTFGDGKDYDPMVAYGQAKTANILTTLEFARRLHGEGILAYSLHPGCEFLEPDSIDFQFIDIGIVAVWTNMAQAFDTNNMIARGLLDPDGQQWDKFKWKTPAEGASTCVYLNVPSTLN